MSDDYDEILKLPPRVSRYDPIEELNKDLLGGGQEGVDKAAAIRRLMRTNPKEIARIRDDTQRGVRNREELQKAAGNRKGKHKVPPETLRDAFEERRRKPGTPSRTQLCDAVGKEHGLSGKQVDRILKSNYPDLER